MTLGMEVDRPASRQEGVGLRIAFMGTPDFAVPSLSGLIGNKENIIAVITQPDRPRGRGGKVDSPPLKKVALKYGLRVEQVGKEFTFL